MSFDKAIKHHKTKRKPFSGAKRVDPQCRNHGSCPYCKDNRTFFDKRKRIIADMKLKEEF